MSDKSEDGLTSHHLPCHTHTQSHGGDIFLSPLKQRGISSCSWRTAPPVGESQQCWKVYCLLKILNNFLLHYRLNEHGGLELQKQHNITIRFLNIIQTTASWVHGVSSIYSTQTLLMHHSPHSKTPAANHEDDGFCPPSWQVYCATKGFLCGAEELIQHLIKLSSKKQTSICDHILKYFSKLGHCDIIKYAVYTEK